MLLNIRVAGLRRLEVVNIRNGCRLGRLTCCEIDCDEGRILSLSAGMEGLFGLSGRKEICIPWCKVVRIGQDAILVDCEGEGEAPPEPCIRL